jgi:hypothetical protein
MSYFGALVRRRTLRLLLYYVTYTAGYPMRVTTGTRSHSAYYGSWRELQHSVSVTLLEIGGILKTHFSYIPEYSIDTTLPSAHIIGVRVTIMCTCVLKTSCTIQSPRPRQRVHMCNFKCSYKTPEEVGKHKVAHIEREFHPHKRFQGRPSSKMRYHP